MLGKIAIGIVVVLAIIVVLAMRQPDTYMVERQVAVNAPPDKVFAQINDFHHWGAWSPWAKLDPDMKLTYGGAATGVGSSYAWTGNSKVGEGRMEIKESMPPNKVTIDLHFIKPFESRSVTTFMIEPNATGSQVTWTMRGDHSFISKVMGVFTSMDAMIGPDFEKGLTALKAAAEAP